MKQSFLSYMSIAKLPIVAVSWIGESLSKEFINAHQLQHVTLCLNIVVYAALKSEQFKLWAFFFA